MSRGGSLLFYGFGRIFFIYVYYTDVALFYVGFRWLSIEFGLILHNKVICHIEKREMKLKVIAGSNGGTK